MSNTNRRKAKKIAEDVLIPLMAERDAALARNAELENERDDALTRLDIAGMHQRATESDWTEDICNHIDLADSLAENERLRAELDSLRGKCVCNTGPGTDGPDETCPVHGRSYTEWIERGDRKQAELDNLRDRVTALADEIDVFYPKKFKQTPSENYVLGWRDLQRKIRAAIVRGSDDE